MTSLVGAAVPQTGTTIVFNVAASTGGAMAVLEDFYDDAMRTLSPEATVILVHSTGSFAETPNIKIRAYPWIKRSWIHRLYFETLVVPRIMREFQVDTVVSLQNTLPPLPPAARSAVLVHNPLPFTEERFHPRRDFKLWLYRKLLTPVVMRSVERADFVVVQTQWMRLAVAGRAGARAVPIKVLQPKPPITSVHFDINRSKSFRTFFYPAGAVSYKNHAIAVEAMALLSREGVRDIELIFTVNGTETRGLRELSHRCQRERLPVRFNGQITREAVLDQLAKAVLVFPSRLETFGLPLLEARSVGAPVLAADLGYAHEVLEGYEHAAYFDPGSAPELAKLMRSMVDRSGTVH